MQKSVGRQTNYCQIKPKVSYDLGIVVLHLGRYYSSLNISTKRTYMFSS